MTTNKRDLKSYARFDGTGRIVPGSLVLRRSKPKVGKWKEIPAYECCNDVTLVFTVPNTAITNVTLRFFCNGTLINSMYTTFDSIDIDTLIDILTQTFNVVGTFTNPSGNIVKLVMSGKQKEALCSEGTLTFDVIAD